MPESHSNQHLLTTDSQKLPIQSLLSGFKTVLRKPKRQTKSVKGSNMLSSCHNSTGAILMKKIRICD